MRVILSALFVAVTAGCATPAPAPPPSPWAVECSEPRPQVCTMLYAPVCAGVENGSLATYSSGCNACADASVIGHNPGACVDE